MKSVKYDFKESKKRLKEAPKAAQTVEPDLDNNLEYVYRYMLRDAKAKGVSSGRADILAMTMLNLFSALVDSKFSTSIESILNRSLKFLYGKIGVL